MSPSTVDSLLSPDLVPLDSVRVDQLVEEILSGSELTPSQYLSPTSDEGLASLTSACQVFDLVPDEGLALTVFDAIAMNSLTRVRYANSLATFPFLLAV